MKTNIKEKLGELFDLPEDVLGDLPKFELYGNKTLIIENHLGVKIYDSQELILNTKLGFFKVSGSDLKIRHFDEHYIFVEGIINSLDFEKGGRDG